MAGNVGQTTFLTRCGAVCRVVFRLCIVLLIAWLIHLLMDWITGLELFADQRLRVRLLVALLIAYAVLISIPFVPGIEIGLSLMMMEGPWIAPLIYISTVAGLCIAYSVGERVPYARLHRIFADLRMNKACQMIEALEPLNRAERLDALRRRTPAWLNPLASRYRYLMIAALVNLPGTSIIGGGGGIMFTAGLSRLFLPPQTVLTILLAVAPVPLAVWIFDIDLGAFLD